jgi:hypothetical protein
MNVDNFTLLEAVVKHAPLGLRFIDLAYGVNVTDGLNVTARPFDKPLPVLRAAHSPVSGVYGFYSMPGFRRYEDDELPVENWCVAGSPPNWIISVDDTLGRFLPQVMPMCLPKKNLFEVPLYSNPARTAMAGYATVRGELWDKAANKPASWAVVSAKNALDTEYRYSTVADGRGMFVLFLPYPKPISGIALNRQAWSLDFQIHYEPKVHRWSGQNAPEPAEGETVEEAKVRIPPDSNVLLRQVAGSIYDIAAGAGATLTSDLHYRSDLVLKTRDKEPDSPNYVEKYKTAEHRLWVQSA